MMKFNLTDSKPSKRDHVTEPEFKDIHGWALFGRWMLVVVAIAAAVVGYIRIRGLG